MKKILLLCVIVAIAAHIHGAVMFAESRVIGFLDRLEGFSLRGENEEFCARMHPDMQVSIRDRSAAPPAEIDGGRREFCEYVSYATRGLDLLGVSMQVQREQLAVKRDWLRPWIAEVTYLESRTTRMEKVNVTLRTQSRDAWTLLATPRGLRVKKLRSETRLAP